MNYRMIKYTLGWLLIFETGFFVLPMLVGFIYFEWQAALAFIYSSLIASGVGVLFVLRKPETTKLYSKDGLVIVALSWIVLSIFGSFPFMFSGVERNFFSALFESASGFTTTGATVFAAAEIEALPNAILIWRSFSNWIGGMGVLVFIMAFIPLSGARNMSIMKAESPGPSVSKLVPRVKTTALILYSIYIALTLAQFIILVIGKTPVFDSICISFSTAGTGGFAIKGDSFASYSPFVQVVTTVFMLVFSINFSSYYLAFRGRLREAFNTEVKVFIGIVAVVIAIMTVDTFYTSTEYFSSLGEALRHTSFTVASIISTTGFSTVDFNLWPTLSRTLIVLIMFIGACAGSTGGGMKVSRLVILLKGMAKEVRMLVHPKRVKKLTLDGHEIEHEVVRSVNAYVICYIILFVISLLAISFEERDLVTNFTAVASTINNVGPGLGEVGPSGDFSIWSAPSKLVLTFDMIAGRLEIFPIMVLFYRGTYKK